MYFTPQWTALAMLLVGLYMQAKCMQEHLQNLPSSQRMYFTPQWTALAMLLVGLYMQAKCMHK